MPTVPNEPEPRRILSGSDRRRLERHDSSFSMEVKKINPMKAAPQKKKAPVGKGRPPEKGTTKVRIAKFDFDQAAEDHFDEMIKGRMSHIPDLPQSVVRVFISSTFSDMRAERNVLMKKVFPELKSCCAKMDLDFQVVDMRWGVTDDCQNDHSVEKLCLQEVRNCQHISLGPSFVVLSGNRYGFQPIPTEMSVEEYRLLSKYSEDNSLLSTWYQKDDNSEPPMYILQPIRSQFPFYGDYSPGCDQPRADDTAKWNKTFEELQKVIRQAAESAHSRGDLRKHNLDLKRYTCSVTELEIQAGLSGNKDLSTHCLYYQRSFIFPEGASVFNDRTSDIHRFIDLKTLPNGERVKNEEVAMYLDDLHARVTKALDTKNCREFTVAWQPGGINPEKHAEHLEYINNFCDKFLVDMMQVIAKSSQNYLPKIRFRGYYTDYQDLIHHLHFCQQKCETFCGQAEVLERAKHYILKDNSHKPLVLHAPSGAGKTSIMAMIMNSLSSWFHGHDHVAIIKFLGTTPLTMNIYDVLYNIMGQLADEADVIMEPVGYKSMNNLLGYMPRFFRRVSNSLKKPIVVLLDSLDQLNSIHDAYDMKWLPLVLPTHMKFIVSTLPREHGILENLQQLMPQQEQFVAVPVMSVQVGKEIIHKYLKKRHRTVTERQLKLLLQKFSDAPGPLYLKLILDAAVKWKSYTAEHHLVLADSVLSAISLLFQDMEVKFGEVFTRKALGYITVGMNGISENELEDVLSNDDEALNDVYRYHNPPVEGIVRLPPLLLARIHHDLQEYIVTRRSFNKHTLNWYHRQFTETAHTKYAAGKVGEQLHKNMADIYAVEDTIKRTIHLTWRKTTIENADRQVTKQIMSGSNRRMLACLPYHIIMAGDTMEINEAKRICFCNFNFLRFKVAAFPLNDLIEEMTNFNEKWEDSEIYKLKIFFNGVKGDIANSKRFAVNLLLHIAPDEDQVFLKVLLGDARLFLDQDSGAFLIPTYPGLAPRRDVSSALTDAVQGCTDIVSCGSDSLLLQTSGDPEDADKVHMHAVYHASSEELQLVRLPHATRLPPLLDKGGKKVYYITDDHLHMLNTDNNHLTSKSFTDITGDQSKKDKCVLMARLNSDFSHLVVMFQDSDVSLIELAAHKSVELFTLKDNAKDIIDLTCSGGDHMTVFVLGLGPEGKGTFIYTLVQGQSSPGLYRNNEVTMAPNLLKLGKGEQYFGTVSNTETAGELYYFHIDRLEGEVNKVSLQSPVLQFFLSKSDHVAVVLNKQGTVTSMNPKTGKPLHSFSTETPSSCLCVSWVHNLALLGNTVGELAIFKIKNGTHMGNFHAHKNGVKQIATVEDHFVSLGNDLEMQVWSVNSLSMDILTEESSKGSDSAMRLLSQKDVTGIDITFDSKAIVTGASDKTVKLWSLDDCSFSKNFRLDLVPDHIEIISDKVFIVLDKTSGKLRFYKLHDGSEADGVSLRNVLSFSVSQDRTMMCCLSAKTQGLLLEVVDLNVLKVKKSFYLKEGLKFESVDIHINSNNRFLVLRVKILPNEKKEIESMWKKQGSYLPQPHPYKFVAVDLTQANGGLIPCYRRLTNIPHLGEVIHPFHGNTVIISTRRWVIFWDIPTGKCDQKVCKGEKKGFMYRPDWLGEECKGTSRAVAQSKNNLLAVGSDDGYVFIYQDGMPLKKQAPQTKHSAPVLKLCFSPNSQWLASACQTNIIKLWDCNQAEEVFQIKVNAEVMHMKFSSDSHKFVVYTGLHVKRVLVFDVHTGSQ